MNEDNHKPHHSPAGLFIKPETRQTIIRHMESQYPREACGLLFGRAGVGEHYIEMDNVAEDAQSRYAMDPVRQIAVFKQQREEGRDLVAIVHSHIDMAAYPSAADIAAATYPEADYLIIAVHGGRAVAGRAFRLVEGRVAEKRVILRESQAI
jgi:[CysO sulfur-carrier protein]-S-L-cysteine hydrolase